MAQAVYGTINVSNPCFTRVITLEPRRGPVNMTESTQARQIFRAVYENRYTWDEKFPGYTADLQLKQGDEVYTGKVRVNSDLSVEATGIEDEQVKESLDNRMLEIVTHRMRSPFEKAHGKNKFMLGEQDHTGAVEILVEGAAMGSSYKVKNKEIRQVNRVRDQIAFTINTQESLQTGDGYISVKYNAVFRDSKTEELRVKQEFREVYEKIDGYYLPTSQVIESIDKEAEKIITEFSFTNIQLLESIS